MEKETIVVLGASNNQAHHSNQAVKLLLEQKYQVIPVHFGGGELYGVAVAKALGEISEPVNTLVIYVNPIYSGIVRHDIIRLRPKRVIFNPGNENTDLEALCFHHGIKTSTACTVTLLQTGLF